MWEKICLDFFCGAIVAAIILGILAFGCKKRQYTVYFWCVLGLGFGVGFLGTAPKQGLFAVALGLVFVVPSLCLMALHLRRLFDGQQPTKEENTQAMPGGYTPVTYAPSAPAWTPVTPAPTPVVPKQSLQIAERARSKPRKEWVNGIPLAYNYVLPFVSISLPNAAGIEIEADVKSTDDTIEYWVDGVLAGRSQDKAKVEMVRDFIDKGEPCIAYILSDRALVNLRFFRDRRKGQEWRKQTVVVPVNYKGNNRQEIISCLIEGQPLLLDEDEKPGTILFHGEPIAKLCAADMKRADEIGVYGLFVEGVEETEIITDEYSMDSKTVYVPHIRIIWMDSAE